MLRALLIAVLALVALTPPAALAADDVTADVDRILATLQGDVDASLRGDSPTRTFQRLLGKKKSAFVKELKARWKNGDEDDPDRAGLLAVIRFVHALEHEQPAVRLEDGVVVLAELQRRNYDFGSFGQRKPKALPPSFATLTKGGKVRKAPKPNVAALLKRTEGGLPDEWSTRERHSFLMALGEGCGKTGSASERLATLAERNPTDGGFTLALAWSGSPQAADLLEKRVRSLSKRVADGRDNARPLLRAACDGLLHIDAARLETVLAELEDAPITAALGECGADLSFPFVLARRSAAEGEARSAWSRRLHTLIGGAMMPRSPNAAEAKGVILALREDLDDARLARNALRAAETLLFFASRYPVTNSASMNGVSEKTTGESVGPYPGIESILRALADDLAEGRAVAGNRHEDFYTTSLSWDEQQRPQNDTPCPLPNMGYTGKRMTVALDGVLSGAALTLTITNNGKAPIVLNPVALRNGRAQWTRHQFDGKKTGDFQNLHLELGFLRVAFGTAPDALVTLAPADTYSWNVPLWDEHRDADHISVELIGYLGVTEKPAARLIDSFPRTWVK